MPTKGTRPRAGLGLSSAMPEDRYLKRPASAKPDRNRNRVKPAKPATHRRPPKK